MPERLQRIANLIRQDIIEMLAESGSGHPGGALGIADVLTVLYFRFLKHRVNDPDWADRDRVVLSAGHTCPVLYAVLSESGYFGRKNLMTLRKLNSKLQGHPHNQDLPGIETSSGPLGQGLSQAVGMALAAKMDGINNMTYVITSDGEHDEGQIWEAVMLAAKYRLSNLVNIIDRNNIQLQGKTEDVLPLSSLGDKYGAFGWQVKEIDGHNMDEIIEAFEWAISTDLGPKVIVANTILGKGVDFMENNYHWHGKAPKKEEAEMAIKQLREAIK